jgi:hypothetical protein
MCSIGWPIPRSVASDRTPSNSARIVPPLFPWCPTCCRRVLLLTPRRPAALDRAIWSGKIGNVTSESFHGWSPSGSRIGSGTDVLHPGRRASVRERLGMGANPRKIHPQESFELVRNRLRSPSAAARNAPQGLFAIAARSALRCGTCAVHPVRLMPCQNMRRMPHDGAGSTDLASSARSNERRFDSQGFPGGAHQLHGLRDRPRTEGVTC